jgi:deoxycytidylate deaminase
MDASEGRNPHIIGLTGSFGSGCTYIADHILCGKRAYAKLSLSSILRDFYTQKTKRDGTGAPRRDLQEFGDKVRREEGANFLARKAFEKIEPHGKSDPGTKWVVDSIRNPAEIVFLREQTRGFFLFGIYADRDTRWNRVADRYDGDRRAFDEDDENDTGKNSEREGQRVGDCFSEADVVLANDKPFDAVGNLDFESFANTVRQYATLVAEPLAKKAPLKEQEALMAMAYAVGQRSSCMQRKVGAIIANERGNVISSGYNEVPRGEQPCIGRFKSCYREKTREDFRIAIEKAGFSVPGREAELMAEFRRHFRILDNCRALHAEENAILNLARDGRSVPLSECTLYTTTYPCRLCARRIANLEFRRIVYLEPYPDPEAKLILGGAGVDDEFFQGVTFRAYFRIYGGEET